MLAKFLPLAAAALTPSVLAQTPPNRLLDGDFDSLTVGTGPDCGLPAGAWWWPPGYLNAGLCEADPAEFRIVPTSTLEPGATGNSLAQEAASGTIHLINHLTSPIVEQAAHIAVAEFDIWVATPGLGGGSVYLGSGGYDGITQRVAQIGWQPDGRLTRALPPAEGGCPGLILDSYPFGAWQHVRLVVDLPSNTFDVWWCERGGTPVKIAANLPFAVSASTHISFIDRFTRVHFSSGPACNPPVGGATLAYLDNVVVFEAADANGNRIPDHEEPACPADFDGNGAVAVPDIFAFLSAWFAQNPAADFDGNGLIQVPDIFAFLSAWFAGCP